MAAKHREDWFRVNNFTKNSLKEVVVLSREGAWNCKYLGRREADKNTQKCHIICIICIDSSARREL